MKNVIPLLFLLIFASTACRESITDPSDEIIEEKPLVLSLKQIEYPSERVIWKKGETHTIKWKITEDLENIRIVLLKKFKKVATISDFTNNDGNFNWTIPSDLPGSHHYRIRLVSPYNTSATSTSIEFEIQSDVVGIIDSK